MTVAGSPTRSGAALAIIATLGFLLSTDAALIVVLIEPVKRDIALSDVQIGLVQGTAFGVSYGLASFPMGWLIDRANRVSLLSVGLVVWMAGLVLTASATGLPSLIVGRVALGIVAALLVPCSLSLIVDLVPRERRSTGTSIFAVGQTIGGAFGILAGGVIYGWLTRAGPSLSALGGMAAWRAIFLGAALLGLPFLWIVSQLRDPGRAFRDAVRPQLGASLRLLAGQRRLLVPLLAGLILVQLSQQASSIWTPPILTRRYGLGPGAFAVWLSPVLLASGVSGALGAGRLGDWARQRFGDRGMLGLAAIGALVMAPLSGFVLASSSIGFALLLALYMTIGAMLVTLGVIAITILVPDEIRGLALGANMFTATMFGTAVAPVAVARFSQSLGGEAHLTDALVLFGGPGLLLAAILFLVALRLH